MLKFLLILSLITLSMQNDYPTCYELLQVECEESVLCRWLYPNDGCVDAIYHNLGHKREIEQAVLFTTDSTDCVMNIKNPHQFIEKTTFHGKKAFTKICSAFNIDKIAIGRNFYDSFPLVVSADNAIIYPKVPSATAYLYTERFFRGDSYIVNGPTKLNGKVIRSIFTGLDARLSLYKRNGKYTEYRGVTTNTYRDSLNWDHGITDVYNAEEIEFVLLERLP